MWTNAKYKRKSMNYHSIEDIAVMSCDELEFFLFLNTDRGLVCLSIQLGLDDSDVKDRVLLHDTH